MAAVAGHLDPRDVVLLDELQQRLPEIAFLNRLLLGVAPAVGAPAEIPLVAEAVHHIRAVAVDGHGAAPTEGAQALDGTGQFHALVGRVGFAAGQLDLVAVLDEDGGPAAGAGIAAAGAVGEDLDGGGATQGAAPPPPSPCPLPRGERGSQKSVGFPDGTGIRRNRRVKLNVRAASRGSGRRIRRGAPRAAPAAPGGALAGR